MSRLVIFLLCALCVCGEVTEKVPPQPPIPISPNGSSTSTTPISPTTTITTIKPTNATTTTPKPTTPPTKPTSPPTKPTPPPTKPTTPPTKPTSPTPAPTPAPVGPPAVNNFTGNYSGSNRICLMMKMAVQLELLDKHSTEINVTEEATGKVICEGNSTTETLAVFWGSNNLTFNFFKNDSKYEIQSISASVVLPGDNKTTTYYHRKAEFSVSDKQSYKCAKDQPLNLTDFDSKTTFAKIHISHLQYQAFMNTTEAQYDSAWYCDATNTPDVVPVVVGCVLAVLVVLVLVAYLFGRRRCQARGYLSM